MSAIQITAHCTVTSLTYIYSIGEQCYKTFTAYRVVQVLYKYGRWYGKVAPPGTASRLPWFSRALLLSRSLPEVPRDTAAPFVTAVAEPLDSSLVSDCARRV